MPAYFRSALHELVMRDGYRLRSLKARLPLGQSSNVPKNFRQRACCVQSVGVVTDALLFLKRSPEKSHGRMDYDFCLHQLPETSHLLTRFKNEENTTLWSSIVTDLGMMNFYGRGRGDEKSHGGWTKFSVLLAWTRKSNLWSGVIFLGAGRPTEKWFFFSLLPPRKKKAWSQVRGKEARTSRVQEAVSSDPRVHTLSRLFSENSTRNDRKIQGI